jgi:hypothetical protein
MRLRAVHRVLIGTFIACAILFGWVMLRRSVAASVIAWALAVAGAVYLATAPHLRRP